MSALAEALVAAQAELPCALGKDATGQIGNRDLPARERRRDEMNDERLIKKLQSRAEANKRKRDAEWQRYIAKWQKRHGVKL